MKTYNRTSAFLLGATVIGVILLVTTTASAATITNSVNQSGGGDWTQAIWGNPPAAAATGNDYLVGGPLGGSFNAVRTINTTSPQSFVGDHLILTNGGVLYMKNAGGACNVNLIVDGGQIIFHGSGGAGAQLGGTLQMNLNPNTAGGPAGTTGAVFYNLGQDQTGGNTRNILLQANVSGNGNLVVNMGAISAGSLNTVQIFGTNSAYAGNWTNNQGTLEIESGSVNPIGSGSVILTVANNSFLSFNATNDLVITNSISGSGSVIKLNTGTVTLNGVNAFTGRTVVSNGVLRIGADSSITNSTVISLAGGTLDASPIGGLVLNVASNQQMNCNGSIIGNLTASSSDTFTNVLNFSLTPTANDVLNISGSLTLNGNPNINLTLNGSKPNGIYRLINYSGAIQGGGSFTLTPPAGSSETFVLTNSAPGAIDLIVSGAVVRNLTWVGDGAANNWDMTSANWTGDASIFSQGDNVTFNDTGSVSPFIHFALNVAPGSITVNNTAQQYVIGDDSTLFGIVTSGGLTKLGDGELDFFTPGNNISGPIDIRAGILSIGIGGSDGSLGTGSITNNGVLQVNLDGGAVALNSPISGSGSLNVTDTGGSSGATVTIGGNGHNSYTGLTTIGNQCQLNIATSNALGSTSSGTIVQSGGRLGVVSVVGSMTVAEPVTINGSGLTGPFGALYVNDPANNVTWAGPITVASSSVIRGVNNSRMNFSGAVTGTDVALTCDAGNPASIGGSDASTTIFFENILSLGGGGSLTMDGVGTVILDSATNVWGNNTTDSTIVHSGALRVDGILNGGKVSIGGGTNFATLAGTGIILGPVTVLSGNLLFPGSFSTPIGTLTVSNSVTLNSGCTNLFELDRSLSPNSSRLAANSISLGGVLRVVNVGAPLQAGDSFTLFSGSASGAFAAVNLPTLSSTNLYWDTTNLNSGTIVVRSSLVTPVAWTNAAAQVSGNNLVFQISPTTSGASYTLQSTPSLTPPVVWSNVQTKIGDASPLSFTNIIVSGVTNQFFRTVSP